MRGGRPLRLCLALLFCLVAGLAPAWGADLEYELSLRVGEDGAFSGRETIRGRAAADWQEIILRLYPNALGEGSLRPLSAELGDREVPWQVEGTVLRVEAALPAGADFSLTISYAGQLPPVSGESGYGIFARGEDSLALAQCYPILAPWRDGWLVEPAYPWGDALVAEVADYWARVEVPAGWRVVGSGREEEVAPGVFTLAGTNLRELGLVALRGYRVESGGDGIPVRSFHLAPHSLAAAQALAVARESLSLYQKLFGPYPWDELDVVELPLREAAGVEYPGLVLAGREYYRRFRGEPLFFPMIFAHEVAHQWWYAQVGNDQVAEPWLDEALVTYSSGLYFESVGRLEEIVSYWRDSYLRGRAANPTAAVDSPLAGFPHGAGYGGIVYSGGALMFGELRERMGREAFLAALRDYLERFRWRIATGEDLISALRQSSPVPLDDVLARYLKHYRPLKLVLGR